MRLFGGEAIQRFAMRRNYDPDEVLEFSAVTRGIERSQERVEANNFGIRKNVLKYDDVMNVQRKCNLQRKTCQFLTEKTWKIIFKKC